jgi:hypothetical protein
MNTVKGRTAATLSKIKIVVRDRRGWPDDNLRGILLPKASISQKLIAREVKGNGNGNGNAEVCDALRSQSQRRLSVVASGYW